MTLTDEQQMLVETALEIGATFGVGGSSWVRTRASGDGISGARTTTTTTLSPLYIVRAQRDRTAPTAPARALVGDAEWRLIAPLGTDVLAGDLFTSSADSTLVFTLATAPDTSQGYVSQEVNPS